VALLGEALMIVTIVGGALILSSLVVVSTTPEVEITDPG
jgi:hypothetical protein